MAYAERWIVERNLATRTRELYSGLLRLHVAPVLGGYKLADLTPGDVRRWRSSLLAGGVSLTTAAKAYRLLRAVLSTAVDDLVLVRNPCRIKGADQEPVRERPVASVPQVFLLADTVPARFRTLILLAAFVGLRWGELIALRRRDLDLEAGTVAVWRSYGQPQKGPMTLGPPKSRASFRTVAFPDVIALPIRHHLARFVASEPDALVFTGERGGVLRRGNFRPAVKWSESLAAAGLPDGFHFHDLRHTGNTLTARAGASTRELMARLGHDSLRAALIYQHATSERDQELAQAVSRRIAAEQGSRIGHVAGTEPELHDEAGGGHGA